MKRLLVLAAVGVLFLWLLLLTAVATPPEGLTPHDAYSAKVFHYYEINETIIAAYGRGAATGSLLLLTFALTLWWASAVRQARIAAEIDSIIEASPDLDELFANEVRLPSSGDTRPLPPLPGGAA